MNEILCVHCLFSFRKFSWILSRTEFCILVVNELVNFLSIKQYAQFQLPRKIVTHHVVRFLYVFKAFTACRVLASRFISVYFWLTLPRKGSRISAWQENNYCLCSRSSAVFHGFYLVQNFCFCIECSKFLVSFNNWIGCILAEFSKLLAYWLLKGMQNFCMLKPFVGFKLFQELLWYITIVLIIHKQFTQEEKQSISIIPRDRASREKKELTMFPKKLQS